MPKEKLKKENEPLVFEHSLSDQIGGQLNTGFKITAMYEETWDVENKMNEFMPSFIGTRTVK